MIDILGMYRAIADNMVEAQSRFWGRNKRFPGTNTVAMFAATRAASAVHPGIARLMEISGKDPAMIHEQMVWTWRMLRWGNHGRPLFDLDPSLAAALMLTECPGLMLSEVRFPFDVMLIRLASASPFYVVDTHSHERCPVKYIWVQRHIAPMSKLEAEACQWRGNKVADKVIAALTAPKEERARLLEIAREQIELWGDAGGPMISIIMQPGELGPTMMDYLTWEEGKSAEDFITRDMAQIENPLYKLERVDEEIEMQKACRRLVVNLVMYLNQHPAKAPKTLRKKKKSRHSTTRPTVYSVRPAIKLPSQLVEAAASYASRGTRPEGWKLQKRGVVRGHWRNQACGPKRVDRKRIWIQPFWRGPEAGEAMDRLYEVKSKDEATGAGRTV